MKILVASENIVKIKAVEDAFKNFFQEIEVKGISVSSNVPNQPFGQEVFDGAKNRIKNLRKKYSADFYVGIEGGVDNFYGNWFGFGIVAISDSSGNIGLGSSPYYQLTDKIVEKLKSGTELGHVIDECSGETNSKTKGGAIGYFTNGVFQRKDLYVSGVIVALVPFLNKNLYFNENK